MLLYVVSPGSRSPQALQASLKLRLLMRSNTSPATAIAGTDLAPVGTMLYTILRA